MRRRHVCIALGAMLCLAAGFCFLNGTVGPRLCVRNSAKELVFISRLPQSQLFCIRFIHSVAKSPVEEWFSARFGRIVLESTVYQDFGAGLPHEAGSGQRMEFDKGLVRISGYNQPIVPLTVRVGRIAEHSLLLEGAVQHAAATVARPALPAGFARVESLASPSLSGNQVSSGGVKPSVTTAALDDGGDSADCGTLIPLFATADTQGKTFSAVRLDALAPAGSALTFSAEFCFWKYCLESR